MVYLERLGVVGDSFGIVWSVACHPTDRIVASCNKNITIWMDSNVKEHKWYNELETNGSDDNYKNRWTKAYEFGNLEHTRVIRNIKWSPCGEMLISASFDYTINLWEFNSKRVGWVSICKILGPESEVKCIDWSSCNNIIAASCRDRAIWLFSLTICNDRVKGTPIDYDCVGVLTGHNNDIKKVKWHPTLPMILFSCSYDNTIIVWAPSSTLLNDKNGKSEWLKYCVLNGHTSTVWDFTFSPCGYFLLSCSDDSTIILWHNDVLNARNASDFICGINSVLTTTFKVALSRPVGVKGFADYRQVDQYVLDCGNSNKDMYLFPIYSVQWCKYLNLVITASGDSNLNVFSVNKSKKLGFVYQEKNAHKGEVNSISWMNDEENGEFVSCGDDGCIILWRVHFDN